jgi:Flp pilus assembly pilin Flp
MILAGLGCITMAAIVALLLVWIHDTKKLHKLKDAQQRETILARLAREEDAQDLTEYALILCLVALVTIASTQLVGSTLAQVFGSAASAFGSQ